MRPGKGEGLENRYTVIKITQNNILIIFQNEEKKYENWKLTGAKSP